MHEHYADVLALTDKPPVWWTYHAYPRWCETVPENCSNIYADRLAFMKIECQQCGKDFLVEFAFSRYDRLDREKMEFVEIDPTKLEYGDPPNINCCSGGPTMSSCPRLLVAAYKRDKSKWVLTHQNVSVQAPWDTEDEGEADPELDALFEDTPDGK